MLFSRICKRFFVITFSLVICFSFFACRETPLDDPIDEENLPALRDYVIEPGHQSIQTWTDTTAANLTSNIKIGWNLGNTFDAHNSNDNINTPVLTLETRWVNHRTTEENISTIKNAGFNAIRIPVTWFKVLDENYIIREDWIARVTEVVNWAEANDMYIILNTHHDERIFKFTNSSVNNSLIVFKRVWSQIAVQFRNYNEKLIFEALNEPRTIGSSYEWQGGEYSEQRNLNRHYQVFVDTVRASGGNNDKRILMVNTYGASAEQNAMNGLVIPVDPVPNKIIVSIHAYTPFLYAHEYPGDNAWSHNRSQITSIMTLAYNTYVRNGFPVIIGEFGARREKDGPIRDAWAEFYVDEARKRNIPCIVWDDGGRFRLLLRTTNTFDSDTYLDAMMRGAGVR